MKKILSFVLMCTMLITPAVSSGCFAGEMAYEPIGWERSETEQIKSSILMKATKFVLATGAVVVTAIGSIHLLDYYYPDGFLARQAANSARGVINSLNGYGGSIRNFTETNFPEIFSFFKNATVVVRNYLLSTKVIISKNVENFMEVYNNSNNVTNAIVEYRG